MPSWITPVALIIFSAFIGSIFKSVMADRKALFDRIEELRDGQAKLLGQVEVLETKMVPLWEQVQTRLTMILHHPGKEQTELDSLLEDLESLQITEEGRERLNAILYKRSEDTGLHQDERDAAHLMMAAMRIVAGSALSKNLSQQKLKIHN